MLNRRGITVLFFIALLSAAFISSARADQENFGGENVRSMVVSHHTRSGGTSYGGVRQIHQIQKRNAAQAYASRFADGIGPRPRAWCGWWMQHRTGITSASTGLNLNRAAEWRRVGSPGDGSPGNILVNGSGRSHVSLILSRDGPRCYQTISGNSGSPYPQVNQLRECGGTTRRI